MSTFGQKLNISVGSAVLFALINLPQTYQLTNKLTTIPTIKMPSGCPNNAGILLHTIVFFILTFLSMGNIFRNTGIKLKHSLYGTLIFFLISSPVMYSAVSYVLGTELFASFDGCPTVNGVVLHSIVYCAVLVGVMYLPN